MTPNQRVLAASTGIALTAYGLSPITIPAIVFAAKIGAERTLDNLNKQQVAFTTQQVQDTIKQY